MSRDEGAMGSEPRISDLMHANALADLASSQSALENSLSLSSGLNALQAAFQNNDSIGNALQKAELDVGAVSNLADILANITPKSLEMRNALAGLENFTVESMKASEDVRNMLTGCDNLGGLAEASKRFSESEHHIRNALADLGTASALAGLAKDTTAFGHTNALAGLGSMFGVEKRMNELRDVVGEGSALGKIAVDIAAQQRTLDDWMREAKTIEGFDVSQPTHILNIESPLLETNTRLARIEEQFTNVLEMAREYAQIAVSLQAAAAELLEKFKKAADDTNKSGSKAIRVGWLALGITFVTAMAQIASPLFVPDYDAAALQKEVVDLKMEISGLRLEQAETSQRLIDALATGDHETAAAVAKAVASVLSVQWETAPVSDVAE